MQKQDGMTIIRTENLTGDSKEVAEMLMLIMASIILKNGGKIELTQNDLSLSRGTAFEINQDSDTMNLSLITHKHPDIKTCQ